MNIAQICSAIQNGALNNDDLTLVIEAVKYRRSRIARETKATLAVGDSVNFTSTKLGRNMTGVVMKIAIKYVTVRTATGNWRVPANMLTVVRDSEFA
jgi:hypothetical protein